MSYRSRIYRHQNIQMPGEKRRTPFFANQYDISKTSSKNSFFQARLAGDSPDASRISPTIQRQGIGGPLDLRPDLCVTPPGLGTVCGSDAAKLCSKIDLPGCSAVCKIFGCDKPNKPNTICPPGSRAAGSKDFEGQCCFGSESDSAQNCCPPSQIGALDFRCCKSDETVVDNHCKKTKDLPPLPDNLCLPPGKRSVLGDKCCFPPEVPKGLGCGLPDINPPVPKPPVPNPIPQAIEIFFKLNKPAAGDSLGSATTSEGKSNFDGLVKALKQDPTLKVQLVGRASPEGSVAYNIDLGARRARLVAAALKEAGVPGTQIGDNPANDLNEGCQAIEPGLSTCGKQGATGERDRQVLARVFNGT